MTLPSGHNSLDIIETDEYGLYSGGWTKKELTPESFSHPAKVSRKLARWICDHAIDEGWLKPGQIVIDPFFGIGGFALDGMAEGAIVVGVELERHFCDMSAGCDCTGISQEDFDEFKGHYEKHYRIPQRCDIQFNPLKMSWERGRESAFAFDATEMVEWLCEYEDETDDIFDAVAEYDVWVPGNFDAHRYEDGRHWCPACVAAAKKADRDEKSGNGTDQMDMFSLLTPEWFTEPHHYEGNVERWKRWGLPGKAICLQGDSRDLMRVLGQVDWAELGLGSPPYATDVTRRRDTGKEGFAQGTTQGQHAHDEYGESPGQLSRLPEGSLVTSSPAFGTAETRDRSPVQGGEIASNMTRAYTQSRQGESESNLASMGMGSPPFGDTDIKPTALGTGQPTRATGQPADRNKGDYEHGHDEGNLAGMQMGGLAVSSSPFQGSLESKDIKFQASARPGRTIQCADYGTSEGQLGAMPPGDIAISSSPFAQSIGSDDPDKRGGLYRDPKRAQDVNLTGTYGEAEGQLASMAFGSPPYINSINASPSANDAEARIERKAQAGIDITQSRNVGGPNSVVRAPQVYGTEEGQMGAMPEGHYPIDDMPDEFMPSEIKELGERVKADMVAASPPFAQSSQSTDASFTLDPTDVNPTARNLGDRAYYPAEMESEGQLGAMGIGSPPMEDSAETGRAKSPMVFKGDPSIGHYAEGQTIKGGGLYGSSNGQLGVEQGTTFWGAARLILLQLHQVLRPGAHSIWVTKPFVRNKQIVDFPGQWRQLNESCGFRLLHRHVCWQIERGAVQLDFDGKEHQSVKEWISFFRRLYNKKYPENAINWEIVHCFERV